MNLFRFGRRCFSDTGGLGTKLKSRATQLAFQDQVRFLEKRIQSNKLLSESMITILTSLCINERLWNEYPIVEKYMKNSVIPPYSMSLYVKLIIIYGKSNQYEKMLAIVEEMGQYGLILTDEIYCELLPLLIEARFEADFFRYYMEAIQLGVKLPIYTDSMISEYILENQQMFLEKFAELPNILTVIYSSLIIYYCKRNPRRMESLLNEMMAKKVIVSLECSRIILNEYKNGPNEIFEKFYNIHTKYYPKDVDIFEYGLRFYVTMEDPYKFNWIMKQVYENKLACTDSLVKVFEDACGVFYWEEMPHYLFESPWFDRSAIVQEKFINHDLQDPVTSNALDRVLLRIKEKQIASILPYRCILKISNIIHDIFPWKRDEFLRVIASHPASDNFTGQKK
jgi:hypothetical protein